MELDPIEIMEAIKFLNKNKTKADKFSEKLYKSVINKFHVKKYIQDLSEIYQEIL
jgi:glycosyltransferase involved in cell wall biosynthesis